MRKLQSWAAIKSAEEKDIGSTKGVRMLSSTQSSSLGHGVSKGEEKDDSICVTIRWFQTCPGGFGFRSDKEERLTACQVLHVRIGMKCVNVWRSKKVKVGGREFYITAWAP